MTNLPEFLYKLLPTRREMLTDGPTDEESKVLAQHFAYLKDLVGQDIVLLAGRTQSENENTFGIVILRAESEQSAEVIMKSDPAVKYDVMRAELFPFKTALRAGAWGATN